MTLKITIKNCKKLKVGDIVTSDPYVVVEINGTKHQTKVIKNTLNPTFDETFTFENVKAGDVCKLVVWDWDKKKKDSDTDDKLGEVNYTIEPTPDGKVERELKFDTKGSVFIECDLEYPMDKYKKQIEEWTSAKFKEVLFDTKTSGWSWGQEKIMEVMYQKQMLVIIVEDEKGNVFGGYVKKRIYDCVDYLSGTSIWDDDSFVFSLESHGRSKEPIKFNVTKDNGFKAFQLYKRPPTYLFSFGNDIKICPPGIRGECVILGNNKFYEYDDKENVFIGKTGEDETFTLGRLQVWQME